MDPQEKWLSAEARRRRRWGGGCGRAGGGGGGAGEAESLDHPHNPSTPILLSMGAHPGGRRSGPGLRRRSISSPLLISKAHYFVLRLAAGQDGSGAAAATVGARFLPSLLPAQPSSLPRTIHRPLNQRTIIYFGEFLGYCFVRANQG